MPGFNGNGTYERAYSWSTDASNGVKISSSRMDTEWGYIVGGFNNCLTRDGQGKPVAAIDWNGQNLSGVNTLGASTANVSAATVFTTLTVGGAASFGGALVAAGAVTCQTTLGVTGATTLGGTLGVSGFATLSNGLSVAGGAAFGSTLTVGGTSALTGNVSMSGTLGINRAPAAGVAININSTDATVGGNTVINMFNPAQTIACSYGWDNIGASSDFRFRMFGVEKMRLSTVGDLTVAGNITASSDRRLKTDIAPLADGLDAVRRMQGVSYTDIATGSPRIGVIAQDMEAVRPEYVLTGEDGFKSVAYGNIVADLIEAVKTLAARVDALA